MIPTLKIGDYLFVNQMRYSLRVPFTEFELLHIDDPKRGDIITFIPATEPGKHLVKRVTGVPGDRIRIHNVGACELNTSYATETPRGKRAYSCDRSSLDSYYEPMVALVEYREHDSGP